MSLDAGTLEVNMARDAASERAFLSIASTSVDVTPRFDEAGWTTVWSELRAQIG